MSKGAISKPNLAQANHCSKLFARLFARTGSELLQEVAALPACGLVRRAGGQCNSEWVDG